MQFRNHELEAVIYFLDKAKITAGKASVGRSKFKESVIELVKEFSENQTLIVDEFDAWEDKEKGMIKSDNPEFWDAYNEILNVENEINDDFLFSDEFFEEFPQALEKIDEELSGIHADVYAKLYLLKENE